MHKLLLHVLAVAKKGDIDTSISQFDTYSESNGLGMNLGREKGDVIEETVREALAMHGNSSEVFAVLEVGAHFGDGTLRIVRALQEARMGGDSAGEQGEPASVIVSLETNGLWASGCKALVGHALAGHGVRHESLATRASAIVAAANAARAALGAPHFHVVLLDHDHDRYLRDLQDLVATGALGPGSLVHADNAGRDKAILVKYLEYVQGKGPFSTRFKEIRNPYRDRVAISQYSHQEEEL